jgi:hypothetical protein
MACKQFQIGKTIGIICGLPRPKPCFYCWKPSECLCDFPVKKFKNGKKKDCDRPLCTDCSQKGISPDVDFCREHFPIAKAAYLRRQNNISLPLTD